MSKVQQADIGIFFGRPDRSRILAEKLRERGFHVTLYNNQGNPGTYVPVRYAMLPAIARLFSTRHQIYLTGLSFVPSLGLYLNRALRGLPYIFNASGLKSAMYQDRSRGWIFPRLAERWLYPILMDRVLAGASWIVCNSRYLQAKLESQFPRYAPKMTTIYNGIDFDRFNSGKDIATEDIPLMTPKLLSVMTWDYQGKAEGAKLIIEAMGLISNRYPGARLIIAAKSRHRRYAQAIEDYRAAKSWKDSVKILYNQTNIPELLTGSDLFIYATPDESNDSLPRSLLEAHAAGLPIVATATTGCPEIVQNSVTGILVPYDAKALAQRVIDLLARPGERQAYGRRGRVHVREQFSWDGMADGYAELFRQMLSEKTETLKTKLSVLKNARM